MKICMVSSEALPFCKVGGLADVVYSLSRKFVVNKKSVNIVLPFYKSVKDNKDIKFNLEAKFDIKMSWRTLPAEVYSCVYRDIRFYFISNEFYFNRENLYGYEDDQERFAFFQIATLKMFDELNLNYNIVHIHDWQTGMIPLLYREFYHKSSRKRPKFIYTIHNAAFLGLVDRKDLYNYFNLSEIFYDNGETRINNNVSYLKAGIMNADRITTVSPSFVKELLADKTNPLSYVLNERNAVFRGILNGIDTKEWNPDTDKLIKHNYTIENVLSQKLLNKKELCKEFGFDYNLPLLGVVSRLTSQKGINLILDSLDVLIKNKINIVILGTGEKAIEDRVSFYGANYPKHVKALIKYSNEMAHKIIASSDFFLMPSLFEPCGITQMLSQRYGTIPIARSTGGLKDTIISYNGANEKEANGILFSAFDHDSFLLATLLGLNLYNQRRKYSKIIHNAMAINNSWSKSYKEYYALYLEAIG